MRVIVDFNENQKINKKISQRKEKLDKFLLANDYEFYNIPSSDNLGYDSFLISDVDNKQFEKIFSFITNGLKASPKCIHLPYEILSIDGEGNIETIRESDTSEINRFVQTKYNRQLEFPTIMIVNQNKYVRATWHEDLISLKCVCCHERAEYINSGLSFCTEHFAQSLKKQKEAKQNDIIKNQTESAEKQLETMNKQLEDINSALKNAKPREDFKKMYE